MTSVNRTQSYQSEQKKTLLESLRSRVLTRLLLEKIHRQAFEVNLLFRIRKRAIRRAYVWVYRITRGEWQMRLLLQSWHRLHGARRYISFKEEL